MAQEQVNPFELEPQQPAKPAAPQQLGAWITPQEGQVAPEGGSYYSVSPEVLQKMWASLPQVPPQPQQVQLPPLPPLV